MNFDNIGHGVMFLFDNYYEDEELQKYIMNIDEADSDSVIRKNVDEIIKILYSRKDSNAKQVEYLFKTL